MNKCETCVYTIDYGERFKEYAPCDDCENYSEYQSVEEARYTEAINDFPIEYRQRYKKDCMYDLVNYVLTSLVKDPIEHYQFTKVLKKAYKDCTGEDYKKSEVK